MSKLLITVLFTFLNYSSYTQSSDTLAAFVKMSTTIREQPSFESEKVTFISRGSNVLVFNKKESFCLIRYKEFEGYIATPYLFFKNGRDISGVEKEQSTSTYKGTTYKNSSTESRKKYRSTKKFKCPARRCSSYTKKGYQCRNRTTNCNGRCHVH